MSARLNSALMLAPAAALGALATLAASEVQAPLLRWALQIAALAAISLATWVVAWTAASSDAAIAPALTPQALQSLSGDRRLSVFDRETGLCAGWYFRLRTEEEIARAARYGQPFTMLTVKRTTENPLGVPLLALKQSLRQVDFAGDVGEVIAIVLPNTDREQAAVVATRLKSLSEDLEVRAAEYPNDATTVSALLGEEQWRAADPGFADNVA